MVLRKIILYLLRRIKPQCYDGSSHLDTVAGKKALIHNLEDKRIYKANKQTLIRISQYYIKHKKLTKIHRKLLERVLNDG